ncbi:MAG: hypothetical protein JNL34_04145 [Anaerolineae bacterium]|nr:hypothetical protein [Anaerolineae bacterium]
MTVPTLAVLPAETPFTPEPPASTLVAPTPTATATATVTITLTATFSPEPPTNSPTAPPASLTATAVPPSETPLLPSLTPSLTITPTLTLTPSQTLTPTLNAGGFSALIDLAARITVQPPDVRYGPATATALWAIGDQLAATARAGATAAPTAAPVTTGVFAIVPGAPLPNPGLGTLPPAPGGSGGVCGTTPGGALNALLAADPAFAAQLGCAMAAPYIAAGAVQSFERGMLIYRAAQTPGAAGTIEAISMDGRFSRYADSWVSGVDPDSGGLTPPPGLIEPIRGFGKVWRSDSALQARLGWALAGEEGVTLTVLPFERGVAIYVPSQYQIYVLADDGAGAPSGNWRQISGSL